MVEVRCHWCGGMVGNYIPIKAIDAPLCCSDDCLEKYTDEDQ